MAYKDVVIRLPEELIEAVEDKEVGLTFSQVVAEALNDWLL